MARAPKPNARKTREYNQIIAENIEAVLSVLDETLDMVDPVEIQRKHREARKLLREVQNVTGWVETIHAIAAQRDDSDKE